MIFTHSWLAGGGGAETGRWHFRLGNALTHQLVFTENVSAESKYA